MADDLDKIGRGEISAASFDIESTGLKADWGHVICASVKKITKESLLGPTKTFRADNYKGYGRGNVTDKDLLKDLVKELNKYDLIIGWYSSRFDFPFINARTLHHGVTPPVKNFRRDLCLSARGNMALTRNSLANVSRFLIGSTNKTYTEYPTWLEATRGDKKAIDYLVDHCEKDVLDTEKVYKKVALTLGKLKRA